MPKLPLPKGVPRTLRYHGLDFEVWALKDGRLAFDYQDGARRVVVKKTSLEKLRTAAETIALSIVNAETAARDLTAEDRRVFITARDLVAPRFVDAVCREAAEAYEIAGPGVSLPELARFYAARPRETDCPPSEAVLSELLAVLRESNRSNDHIRGISRDVTPFVKAFPDLRLVSEKDVRNYLRNLTGMGGKSLGTRRRDNIRDSIVRLFTFARSQHYLPERKTEAEKVLRIDEGVSAVTTYTPRELQLLISHVSSEWRPWLLIGAFAGLRTSEIFRLEWNAIRLDERTISVGKRVARKVKISRKVPISENLAAFLAEYSDRHGPLYPNTHTHGIGRTWLSLWKAQHRALKTLAAKCGLRWERNALRHSYGSHRLAIIRNEAQLVLEMGNSIGQVREHYNDPKTEAEAAAYFAIRPDSADSKILHLDLKFA
jgi:integrase